MAKKKNGKNGNGKNPPGADIQKDVATMISLGQSEMFIASMEALNPQQRAVAWTVIDRMEKVFAERKSELREALFETVMEIGDQTEAGHFIANIEGNEVKRERRQGKSPEDKPFRSLLKDLSIPLTDCYSEETTYKLDPSKVQYLIDGGRLPAEKVEELRKVTFALKVKPESDLAAELDRTAARFKKLKKASPKK